MQLHITNEAAAYYKKEMGLKGGDELRLFVKLAGHSTVHPNYSLGIIREAPVKPAVRAEADGIAFFLEEQDGWFIGDYDLRIGVKNGEIDMEMVLEQGR